MRVGLFEVLLFEGQDDSTGQEKRFKEETIDYKDASNAVTTRSYIHAAPGVEYNVKVNIYRDRNGNFPYNQLRIGLYVDGNDVNYWKRIDFSEPSILPRDKRIPASSTFWGFKKNTEDLVSFVFATPSFTDLKEERNQNQPLGSIKVVIYEAQLVSEGGVFHNKIAVDKGIAASSVNERKKFHQQASLTTKEGRKVHKEREKFDPLVRWVNKSTTPIQIMTLYYHTPSTISLLSNMASCNAEITKAQGGIKRKANELIDLTETDDEGGANNTGENKPHEMTDAKSANGGGLSSSLFLQEYDTGSPTEGGVISASSSSSSRRVDIGNSAGSSSTVPAPEAVLGPITLASGHVVTGEISIDNDVSMLIVNKQIPCLDMCDDDDTSSSKWITVIEPQIY